MGIYNNFKDTPDAIKNEGQEIELKFTRNGDGTGKVCWNIPAPLSGCSADDQAYDGIVITVSSKPGNYTTTSPTDGEYYNGDATGDVDLHAGDKLDFARIVGAFYHDKETTCITITDIEDRTPYYFSAYAVDKVGRYHREGVHAYSIPETKQQYVGMDGDIAYHDIGIDTDQTVLDDTSTGLLPNKEYAVEFKYNKKCYTIKMMGHTSQSYGDMVDSINIEMKKLFTEFESNTPPNSGGYYIDVENQTGSVWDGHVSVNISPLYFNTTDPTVVILGQYWYNTDTELLQVYESGGWASVSGLLTTPYAPRELKCDDIWFDGTTIRQWSGTTWCDLPTHIQTRNPLWPPLMDCDSYWYIPSTGEFKEWDTNLSAWVESLVMVYNKDPNDITTGDFWYNETDAKMYLFVAGDFDEIDETNIRYEERNEDGELDDPEANLYWYIPSEQTLYKRNISNDAWVEQDFVSYPTDPTVRESCNLWWDTTTGVDTLYKWDSTTPAWVEVTKFTQSEVDPSKPTKLEKNSAWYNSDTGEIQLIMGTNCLPVNYIYSSVNPNDLMVGYVWYNSKDELWFEWDGSEWINFIPLFNDTDPNSPNDGDAWFDTQNNVLNIWDSGAWVDTEYSTDPLVPQNGDTWFDTSTKVLYEWNGTIWNKINPDVYLNFLNDDNSCDDGVDVLRFKTREQGCDVKLKVDKDKSTIITNLALSVIWYREISGKSKISTSPKYKQLGVGTDGSPDERRKLQSDLRETLGGAGMEVELTKNQLDICINNALNMIRKNSGYAYDKGFFFLDLNPNQQTYYLTDECVGFNKIVDVTEIYRVGPFNYSNGVGGSDNSVFSFGAMQQLYSMQTFDILSYHLIAQYLEELEFLFARKIMFQWTEEKHRLRIYQTMQREERVLIEGNIERTEQDILNDREVNYWIFRWALAEAKMILSQVRGKYQALPGPNGSTTLNSQELITQAENERAELAQELQDLSMHDTIETGAGAHIVFG